MDGMDQALQRMAEGPRLADLWDTERKMLNVFNAWTALRQRSLEHNTVMLEAWLKAAGKFAKDLNETTDRKEALGSWRELLALWVETANTALLETQRSDAYLKSQREILKASTDLRLAQQEIAAFYSEMFGYPTRAELDDVHRTVTELRRELRALQRANRDAPKAARQPPKGSRKQPTQAGPNRNTP
jgi:class III poly(R)-hydroxyalkanoic acid synthase PhaE subunit